MFGHTVKVYNPERTVCDIIRAAGTGSKRQTFDDALGGMLKEGAEIFSKQHGMRGLFTVDRF